MILREYNRNGVIVLRKFFLASIIQDALQEAKDLSRSLCAGCYDQSVFWKRQNGSTFLEKIEPVIDRSKIFRELSRHKDLLRLVGVFLADQSPCLLKDKLIFKYPGQNGYPLHQDYNWWHKYSANDICTAVIPLERATILNGGIEFYLGCHKKSYLPDGENRELMPSEVQDLATKEPVCFELDAGDILIFHSLTPHFSGRNMSYDNRTQFYPTFCSSSIGNEYEQQLHQHRILARAINQTNIY